MEKSTYQNEGAEIADNVEVIFDSTVDFHESVIRQINEEYWAAWWFHKPRVQEWLTRLKLYNNQKRDKARIGSPDIFSFHQTLLAHLYEDRLGLNFKGRLERDMDAVENFNFLAENDYDDMHLAETDYDWDFDASLFGRGLLLMNDWDYESLCPLGEVIDPLTWLRDPNAQSVNGNVLRQYAMRFGGREIRRTGLEMKESGDYINLDYLKKDAQGFRTFSPLWDAERARKEAQGFQTPYQSYSLTKNLDWTLLQWFTVIDGEKYMVELGNERTLIVRMEKIKGRDWPIIDRTMYPIAHDWDGVSVFDVMEDKQRFRAQLLNVYGDLAKAKLYDMWLYDENKIRKHVDLDFEFAKRIPVDGNPANSIVPLKHADAGGEVQFMLDFLDKASQKALGISEQSLGQSPKGKQSLGSLQQKQANLDVRMSLPKKIWGWSENKRWRRWYEMYTEYFGGIDRKIISTEGMFGKQFEKVIRKEDIMLSHSMGPKIEIETKSESEARKLRKYQQLKDYMVTAIQLPETDKVYGIRKLGEQVLKRSEIRFLIPYSHDENLAIEENELLNKGKVVKVNPEDNHQVHRRIHSEAKDTPEAEAHMRMHDFALMAMKQRPDLFPGQQPQGEQSAPEALPASKSMAGPATEGMSSALEAKPK